MKKVVFLLLAMVIFMLCASVGYEMATRTSAILNGGEAASVPGAMTESATSVPEKINCVASIEVDRLDVESPRLISTWTILMYFDEQPSKISIMSAYLPNLDTESSKQLVKNFKIDDKGAPSENFMRTVAGIVPGCKDYIMIDEVGVVKVLNWINGREDMEARLKESNGNNDALRAMFEEACDKVTGSAGREMPPFHWTDLAPEHIRTNLMMDNALLYWDRAAKASSPDTCSVSINE